MTRTCYDLNNCEYSYNIPNEVAGCEEDEKSFVKQINYAPYFMGILTIIVLLVLLGVLIKR